MTEDDKKPTDHQQMLLRKLRLKLPSEIIQKKMERENPGRILERYDASSSNWGSRAKFEASPTNE